MKNTSNYVKITLSREGYKRTMANLENEIASCQDHYDAETYETIQNDLYNAYDGSGIYTVPMSVIDYIVSEYDYNICSR